MDELVDIIDEDNLVLQQTTKFEAHQKGLLHRTVIGDVRDSAGNWLLVTQSADRQDAGQLVSPVGGHVRANEPEHEALKREALEEIGLAHFTFDHVGNFVFKRTVLGRNENHYFMVYKIITDEPLMLGNEADSYEAFSEQQLRQLIKNEPHRFGGAFYAVVRQFYPHMLA